MTDIFVKYDTGDDANDGTDRTLPKKTLVSACTGRTGGDEIKISESPAPTALVATATFTYNSATVTLSEDNAEVAAYDYIKPDSGSGMNIWWRVNSVAGTTITLTKAYMGATVTNGETSKRNASNCFAIPKPAASATHVEELPSSGTSDASRLVISGGWDLTQNPPVQTGETWYYQNAGNNDIWGYLICTNTKSYLFFDKVHILNFNEPFYFANGNYIKVSNCWGTNYQGINQSGLSYEEIDTCEYCATSGSNNNIYVTGNCGEILVHDSKFIGSSYGVAIATYTGTILVRDCLFDKTTAVVTLSGIVAGSHVIFKDCDFGVNTNVLSNASSRADDILFYNCTNIGAVSNTTLPTVCPIHTVARFKKYNNNEGDDRAYGYYGYSKSNSADARNGVGYCIEAIPSNASNPYYLPPFFIPADADTQRIIYIYAKKEDSPAFNGTCEASLWFKGEMIDGWDTWELTTSYAQYALTAPSEAIDENGVIELRIRITGTAGSIFLDDMSYKNTIVDFDKYWEGVQLNINEGEATGGLLKLSMGGGFE